MAWIERTAYPRLPGSPSVRELAEVFTPSADELAWAEARIRAEHHRLALLVLLVCYKRLGYFPRLDAVAAGVIEHVREAAGLGMSVSASHDSERTLSRHREWVRTRLGVVYEPARVRAVAESAMRAALLSKDNPTDVINVALEALAHNQCELPGYTTLDEMAAGLRAEVNGEFYRLVAPAAGCRGACSVTELVDRGSGQPAQRVAPADAAGAEGDGEPA